MTYAENFLYPYRRYRGAVKPENLVFDANLQEFSQRVSFICNLENNGKLSPEDAFKQIQQLWTSLDRSRQQLGIQASD
ncbi:MAG: DUF7219 family protein [Thainema sp.]